MTRTQFWILTIGVLVVGPFFLTDIYLNQLIRMDEHKVAILERIIQEGDEYSTRWRQLAVRIYQAGQQDAALKDVLAREHINIEAKPHAATADSPSQDPTPSTTGTLSSTPGPASK